ncbi:hypothetical protein AI28_00955 [bacteria symbiont BFo1 of Frankliniella occidentalis]|nr:hypothetical protein AI28_00955 [bacteria symbiont BFo1 of Frankliniella occidentalis]
MIGGRSYTLFKKIAGGFMGLSKLFYELINEGHMKVWIIPGFGPEDDDGNRMLIDLLFSSTGDELARRSYWPDQDERHWKMTTWAIANFELFPENAVELDVRQVFARLTLGMSDEAALSAVFIR